MSAGCICTANRIGVSNPILVCRAVSYDRQQSAEGDLLLVCLSESCGASIGLHALHLHAPAPRQVFWSAAAVCEVYSILLRGCRQARGSRVASRRAGRCGVGFWSWACSVSEFRSWGASAQRRLIRPESARRAVRLCAARGTAWRDRTPRWAALHRAPTRAVSSRLVCLGGGAGARRICSAGVNASHTRLRMPATFALGQLSSASCPCPQRSSYR
jgi:hypothetical protein